MLCDHVQPGGDGKLYVTGGGSTLFLTAATGTPFALRVGLAAVVELSGPEATGTHPVEVRVMAGDGTVVPLRVAGRAGPASAVAGRLEVGERPEGAGDVLRVEPFSCLLDLEVPAAGTYAVVVSVDGEDRRVLPFRAGLVPAPDQQPDAGAARGDGAQPAHPPTAQ